MGGRVVRRLVTMSLLCGVLLSAGLTGAARAAEAEPLFVFEGDGLKITVTSWGESDGTVGGEIRRGDQAWPFTGRHSEDDAGNETVKGTFKAGKTEHEFTSRQETGSDVLTFTTGNKTYKLRPAEAGKPHKADTTEPNPLADEGKPTPNGEKGKTSDVPSAPAGKLPETMKLKLHVFPDVTMGAPAAYAATLPEGWTSRGNIEWSPGELSYPQPKIELLSKDGGRVRFIPAINLMYTRSKGLAIPPQGVAPPDDFPNWFIEAVRETNKAVSNVELITSRRDKKMEAMQDQIQRDIGANDAGMKREVHVITFEYDEAGVRRREEATMLYARIAPIDNVNIFSQAWSIYTTAQVSAPKEKFEQLKESLYGAAAAVRPTPAWFVQSQAVLRELSRIRIEARGEAIRRRGAELSRMSDEAYRQYKSQQQQSSGGGGGGGGINSDGAQRDRLNTIYETSDYRDSTGDIVNLPMHYQHVYSDGKGNYVLTNNSQHKPGELWNEINVMK